MKKIKKSELISAIVESANGDGSVFVIEHNNGDIDIWVNTASISAIEMGGVDVLYSRDFSNWNTTGDDLDEADIEFDFDKSDIESDLNENGIEVV